jgi:hypothetical protein
MRVFISYAKEDRDRAEDVAVRLRQEDHVVFFDRTSLAGGDGYDKKLREEIRAADLFVFVISPDSVQESRYTITELKFAQQRWTNPQGRILPVVARPTPAQAVPSVLGALSWVEPEGNWASEVVAAVDALLGRIRRRRQRTWLAAAALITAVLAGGLWLDRDPDSGSDGPPQAAGEDGGAGVVVPGNLPAAAATSACVDFPLLMGCGFDLAEEICAASAALQSEDRSNWVFQTPDADRRALYTHAMTSGGSNPRVEEFLSNVGFAFGDPVVRHAENHGDLHADWEREADALVVLNALLNQTGADIPDGESTIYFGDDNEVIVPFRVEGANWREARERHRAAFAYSRARHAPDLQSKRRFIDQAIDAAGNVCTL